MKDLRIKKLAENLVNYSCGVKKGEKVLIEATDCDHMLVNEIIKLVYQKEAFPFVNFYDQKIKRELLLNTNKEHCRLMAKYAKFQMQDMNAYIGVRGGYNSYELSDIPAENNKIYSSEYSHPVHHELRVKKTKWVVLRYPGAAVSQLFNLSSEKFEDFYFKVCNLSYEKMDKAMNPLKALMESTDKVRILGKNTDLSFSIKGMKAVKCSGKHNIPDGEIYTAPLKTSVNGRISYNAPSIENGLKHENIVLDFKDGKIINASSNHKKELNKILDTDEGARYVGEFALGVNPYIKEACGDILFDEKINGSLHFTPGCCYEDADNGNNSAVHWDMVYIQTKKCGGGEIWFDDKLIRKDGVFVLESLKALNNLK